MTATEIKWFLSSLLKWNPLIRLQAVGIPFQMRALRSFRIHFISFALCWVVLFLFDKNDELERYLFSPFGGDAAIRLLL